MIVALLVTELIPLRILIAVGRGASGLLESDLSFAKSDSASSCATWRDLPSCADVRNPTASLIRGGNSWLLANAWLLQGRAWARHLAFQSQVAAAGGDAAPQAARRSYRWCKPPTSANATTALLSTLERGEA